MKSEWVDTWAILDYDQWSDPVPAIKVREQDIINDRVSAGARILNLWIRFQACHGRLSEYSKEKLAKDLCTTPGTISRWLKELDEDGLLELFQKTWLTDKTVGQVYFIQARSGGPIKIGKAVDPKQRLGQLQTSHPEPLVIIGVMEGGLEMEKQLHIRFSAYRVHGEWFMPCDELLEYIRSL